MKLTVFQSDEGDCLLVEASGGEHMLVDGGKAESYRAHVAPKLAELRDQGAALDLIYVSHIDEDHIEGVLELMQAEVDWRVHGFQVASGNAGHRPPKVPRAPEVKELWHNAFHELTDENTGPVEDMLATTAAVLDEGDEPDDAEHAERNREIGTSVAQGIRLSRRAGAEQLKIPLNRAFDGKLALVRDGQGPVALGSLELTVIGPFEEDLAVLRKEWNDWLDHNAAQLEKLQARMRADAGRLGTSEVDVLRGAIGLRAAELGDRRRVTAPNLASLMLLARDGTKTVLLTGDGHSDDILKGLERAGELDAAGAIHVDVLKVQHHGAEFNARPEFWSRVTADRYVFCGNGAHENPDLRVLDQLIATRVAQPGDAFELLFNSSSKVADGVPNKKQMKLVEELVAAAVGQHPDRVKASFLEEDFVELDV